MAAHFIAYARAIGPIWFAVVTGVILAAPDLSDRLWPKWKAHLSAVGLTAVRRRRIEAILLLLVVVWAGYSAWDQERQDKESALARVAKLTPALAAANSLASARQAEIARLTTVHDSYLPRRNEATSHGPPKTPIVLVQSPEPEKERPVQFADPDGIYQLGQKVGVVVGANPRLSEGVIEFARINGNSNFNPDAEFQYRQFTLGNCGGNYMASGFNGVLSSAYGRGVCQVKAAKASK